MRNTIGRASALTPVPKSDIANIHITNNLEKPFWWDSVQHSAWQGCDPTECKVLRADREIINEVLIKMGIDEKTIQQNPLYKDDLENYLDNGLTQKEIAKKTGLSALDIRQKAERYGLSRILALNNRLALPGGET